ncbi:tetratricopeptide repeat-containing diguanylate cyclase, partial [Piscinibacter sp.]|uniref:tetratricopeptide repeat-containing diguanylate cyclase n=1 Tax=Piscinibacter sp. TaxID=1903157 RepID=UPI002F402F52
MNPARARSPTSAALRLARKSWKLQHLDSSQAIALAEQALVRAIAGADVAAEAWARLSRGFHLMYYATPGEAAPELAHAQRLFDATLDRAGRILAGAGMARCLWREGKFRESLDRVLPLRGEGLRLLQHDERGILLNTIAGCYSAQGESEQAFAYMYQALRDSGPARGRGFDAVLYCNLAHELLQLGDYHEALRHVDEGVARCTGLKNARLLSVLLVNRVICLTDLDRPHEALPDIRRVLNLPTDASGRGSMATHFETMAIAALRAGDVCLGSELVERARCAVRAAIPDEQFELVVANAELASARGLLPQAAEQLEQARPLAERGTEGLSLRVRCLFFQTLADVRERMADAAQALAGLRTWQRLHVERAHLASRARYQAAALHTELVRLQHELDQIDARRRSTERAKLELETINQQLSQKVDEVQSLQTALRQQAVRDFLTGLFNRRHLNDILPSMMALAQRDGQPLAVALIDLDHFKDVNDRHGHGAGDRLLAAFGDLLGTHGRKSDVACRYGGEEFCVLMPRTDAMAARRKIGALLKLWR